MFISVHQVALVYDFYINYYCGYDAYKVNTLRNRIIVNVVKIINDNNMLITYKLYLK